LYITVLYAGCTREDSKAAEEGDSVVAVDGGKVPLAARRKALKFKIKDAIEA
jgi:hypothetical protein